MPPKKKNLSELADRQRDVLAYILHHIEAFDGYPTVREIGDALGIASTNGVQDHLNALMKKGYLLLGEGQARGLRVLYDLDKRPFHNRTVLAGLLEQAREDLQIARAAALTPELVEQLRSLLGPALTLCRVPEEELAPAALLGEMLAYATDLRAENALLEAEVERLHTELRLTCDATLYTLQSARFRAVSLQADELLEQEVCA